MNKRDRRRIARSNKEELGAEHKWNQAKPCWFSEDQHIDIVSRRVKSNAIRYQMEDGYIKMVTAVGERPDYEDACYLGNGTFYDKSRIDIDELLDTYQAKLDAIWISMEQFSNAHIDQDDEKAKCYWNSLERDAQRYTQYIEKIRNGVCSKATS